MKRRGRRVHGGVSGFFCGVGVAILLQQFAVVPLSTLTMVLVPLGLVLVGVALGWPRAPRVTSASPGAAGPPPPAPGAGSA